MKKLAEFVNNYTGQIILAFIGLTLVFGFFALQVEMTTDIKDFFPADDNRVKTYDQVEELFGGGEYIMVALEAEEIFSATTLQQIDLLSSDIASLSGVAEVKSITTVDSIKGTEWGLEIAPFIDRIPETEKELAALKNEVMNDDMYGGVIVSEDGKAALLIIEVAPDAESVAVADEIGGIVNNYQGPGQLYLTGTPVLNNVLARSMQGDLKKLVPVVLLIIALILYLYFRSWSGVVLPFVTVIISVIWTLGLMGLLNKPLSPINAVMPIILISLGNAYVIYLLNRYYEEFKISKDASRSAGGALTSVGLAILMAGATTVAGFASNVFSDITLMRDFGIFTSFGIGVALLSSLLLIPAVLVMLKLQRKEEKARENRLIEGMLNWLSGAALYKTGLVLIITLVLVIIALAGIPRLSTDSNFFNFFADDSQPKIAYNLVRDKFTGSESIEIVLEGDIQNPAVLQAMADFQADLEETGLVGQPLSLANIIERTNQAMHENDPAYKRIPEDGDLIAQYLLLLEMSDDSYLAKFVTADYSKARIQALVKDTSSSGIEALRQAVEKYQTENFAGLKVGSTETGIIVLIDALAGMIIRGQINGLIFALLTVFLIVLVLLKSWKGSILSVLLIALVILINFGVMGWAGIAIDIVTVLISSIGVGVGIDYSIHIYSRFLEEKERGRTVKKALDRAIRTTGRSILSNAAAVISGFIILIFSSFPPFKYFGVLVTLIMFVAAAGAMAFIPAMVITLEGLERKLNWKGGVRLVEYLKSLFPSN